MRYLVNRKPVRTVDIWNDLDNIFENFWTGSNVVTKTPAVDIRETADSYELEAELPGFTEKDVEVKIEENLLSIRANLEEVRNEDEDGEEKKDKYLVRERRSTSFSRSFVLPKDADADKITAEYRNGVLSLSVPKTPAAQPKLIQIKKK